jgi:tRNA pseudouridine32 synthase/23S rRNA pseudouridine746 synthase
MQPFSLTKAVDPDDPRTACEFLAKFTNLSKGRIKDAMLKGAVWHHRRGAKNLRIRRATATFKPGDVISIYYNENLLAIKPTVPQLVSDYSNYSVWLKPSGLMTQGTEYGDHCSLMRQVQLFFKARRKLYPVHRLDREASGLVLVAHDKQAASSLSRLFQTQKVVKRYHVQVLGNLAKYLPAGNIEQELDGRSAHTEFAVQHYDSLTNTSSVKVVLHTGRKHQIRRHFNLIGYPVMGDPRYGKGNKNSDGMKLLAYALEFECPYHKKKVAFSPPRWPGWVLKMNVQHLFSPSHTKTT